MGSGSLKAGWRLALYPEAGEAGGSFRGLSRRGWGSGDSDLWVPDEGRSSDEAARRARGKVRRYCAANLLNRLGTLTYRGEGCHDPRQVRADLGRFFRRLRSRLGGEPFPYAWVPELHKTDHGFHAHFAVGRFIRRGLIDEAWGHGFIKIRLHGDLPVGSGARGEARQSARYLAKYVDKTFRDGGGLNRYDVAQGFQPSTEALFAPTEEEVRDLAIDRMGEPPAYVWRSIEHDGWCGPSAVWMQWR